MAAPSALIPQPHKLAPPPPPECTDVFLVSDAPYYLHHYAMDGVADQGWGCGYRTLQTILSWYRQEPVPSLREIQRALVELGDKPEAFEGSKEWIGGAVEVALCVERLCGGTPTRILHAQNGLRVPALLPALAAHFKGVGSPAMMGGSTDVCSKTLLGVALCHDHPGRSCLLIADPHFVNHGREGPDGVRERLVKEGWLAWKRVGDLQAGSFYNIALPQRRPPAVARPLEAPAAAGTAAGGGDGATGVAGAAAAALGPGGSEDFAIEVVGAGHEGEE